MPIKHLIRKNGKDEIRAVSLTAQTSIQAFYFECMDHQRGLVQGCTDKLCPLFLLRIRGKPKGAL